MYARRPCSEMYISVICQSSASSPSVERTRWLRGACATWRALLAMRHLELYGLDPAARLTRHLPEGHTDRVRRLELELQG